MTATSIIVNPRTSVPFLLNLRIESPETPLDVTYDERRSFNVVRGKDELPLVNSKYALATQTKTKAKSETDDDDW